MIDLRCESKKHGVLISNDIVEIKCDSRFCGARTGVIVLHRFSSTTGELLETYRYNDPMKEVKNNAAQHNPAAVRSA